MNTWDYPMGADTEDAPWNGFNKVSEYGNEALSRLYESINKFDNNFADYICGEHMDYFTFDTYDEITQEIYLQLPKKKRDELEDMYIDELFDCVVESIYKENIEN